MTVISILAGSRNDNTRQQVFTTTGTVSWTVPYNVTRVSAVCIGAGGGGAGGDNNLRNATNDGGGGGALCYGQFDVTPGEVLTLNIGSGGLSVSGDNGTNGGDTSILRGVTALLTAGGGAGGLERNGEAVAETAAGGTYTIGASVTNSGGGNGGAGGTGSNISGGTGGGGAGGYSAAGGAGGAYNAPGSTSTGGGGGGGGGYTGTGANVAGSGGGTGILGAGSNGTGGTGSTGGGGLGGSGGTAGSTNTEAPSGVGGNYGGGGGGRADNSGGGLGANGGQGAIRIVWGPVRRYPSTNTTDINP